MNNWGNIDRMYFAVRDAFGDPIGETKYPTFEDAADAFKRHCVTFEAEADGAWLGVVFNGETRARPYKCALVQHNMTSMGSRYRSMEDNISQEALAVPEIKLAALKASQLQYPFDERTQMRIDELEKRLGVFERNVDTSGDLHIGKWRVHIVPPGGRYGLNNCLTNKRIESLVEFWDMSANKGNFPAGQFVSRYYVETLLSDKWGASPEQMMRGGLCLDGRNEAFWSVSGAEMVQVFNWFKRRELQPGENYLHFSGEVEVPFDVIDRIPLPHMDSAYLASDVALNQILNGLPFVRDLCVERTGENKAGTSYTYSFVSQAEPEQVMKDLSKALVEMPYNVAIEPRTIEASLDNVIQSCERLSKAQNAAVEQEQAGKDDRPPDRDF